MSSKVCAKRSSRECGAKKPAKKSARTEWFDRNEKKLESFYDQILACLGSEAREGKDSYNAVMQGICDAFQPKRVVVVQDDDESSEESDCSDESGSVFSDSSVEETSESSLASDALESDSSSSLSSSSKEDAYGDDQE